MTDFPLQYILTLFVALSFVVTALIVQSLPTSAFQKVRQYQAFWDDQIKRWRLSSSFHFVPHVQAVTVPFSLVLLLLTEHLFFLGSALAGLLLPLLVLKQHRRRRSAALELELDTFLTSLADALTAVPNLREALASLHGHLNPPLREEVGTLLGEIRLGSSLEDAMRRMASRINLPGLDSAVEAALLSHRVGGDLPRTLRRISRSIREMARLEGVVKTKTAEGRTQAWVMGAVPPGIVLILEKMDPEWLAPMWEDPIGWIILGIAAIFEVVAVALIRRIMAVDI
jgi:tight adherence protein B